jgi:hypothetical protein
MKRIVSRSLVLPLCLFLFALTGTAAANEQPSSDRIIALSESFMPWADAVAWCQQQGGKLPRINNSDSGDGENPPMANIPVDGFGTAGLPRVKVGLPSDVYWTGTVVAEIVVADISDRAWFIMFYNGKVSVNASDQSGDLRAFCVP